MASKAPSRSFVGNVCSLISAGDEGQEILHIRTVDGDGDRVDIEFNVSNGKILAETLKLKADANRRFMLNTDAPEIVVANHQGATV
jgi:hypothetical protein